MKPKISEKKNFPTPKPTPPPHTHTTTTYEKKERENREKDLSSTNLVTLILDYPVIAETSFVSWS